ncbi:MAG: LysR family transcriptional regulator [Lentisphaeria bacterium]|nr:LysR family transcriptional regulator [Lentisphaeria bacterium]
MNTIKQLRHFLALARELHFARAASQLGISQAALSNEIKKLETSLGFQLFDRSDRWEITLTDAGKSFFNGIKDIPETLDFAKTNAAEIARGKAGTLSIAISYFYYDYFNLGEVCRKMQERYPNVKLRICDMQRSSQIRECLKQGQADVGFMMLEPDASGIQGGLEIKRVCPIELMIGMTAKHPLAKKEFLTAADLKNAHWIIPPKEEIPAIHKKLEDYYMENCQTMPIIKLEIIGFTGICQMISTGLGIGFVPELFGHRQNLIMKKTPFPMFRQLVAAKSENNNSLLVKNFISLIPQK